MKRKNVPLLVMETTFWELKWKSHPRLFGRTWPNLLHLKEEDVVVGVAEEAAEDAGAVVAAVIVAEALVGVAMPITNHLVNADPDLIDLEGLLVVATILVIDVMIGDMLRIRLVACYDCSRIVVS